MGRVLQRRKLPWRRGDKLIASAELAALALSTVAIIISVATPILLHRAGKKTRQLEELNQVRTMLCTSDLLLYGAQIKMLQLEQKGGELTYVVKDSAPILESLQQRKQAHHLQVRRSEKIFKNTSTRTHKSFTRYNANYT